MEGLNSDGVRAPHPRLFPAPSAPPDPGLQAQEAKATLGDAAPGAPYTPRVRKPSSGTTRAAPRSGGAAAAKGAAGSPAPPPPAPPKPAQTSPAAVAAAAAARRAAVAASGVTASPAVAAAPQVSSFVDAAAEAAAFGESCVLPTAEAVLENVATPGACVCWPAGRSFMPHI